MDGIETTNVLAALVPLRLEFVEVCVNVIERSYLKTLGMVKSTPTFTLTLVVSLFVGVELLVKLYE